MIRKLIQLISDLTWQQKCILAINVLLSLIIFSAMLYIIYNAWPAFLIMAILYFCYLVVKAAIKEK